MSRMYRPTDIEWLTSIPADWEETEIGREVWVRARLGWKGLTAEEYVDDGVPMLATPDIKDPDIHYAQANKITRNRYLESPEIMLQDGDVLLTKDGSTIGTVNVVRDLPSAATVNGSIAVLTPTGEIDGRYLFWFIASSYAQSIFVRLRGGMGVPHLFQRDINRIRIPRPPLTEQGDIAAYLDRETARIDTLIEEQQRLIELLRERRQAIIGHWMLDSPGAQIRLSRIASSRSGDVPPPLEGDGQYVVWGAGRAVGYTSQSNARAGDLLVGRVGQGSVGKVRLLTEDAWATDNTIVLRLDLSAADPRYIEHSLRLIPRFELVGGGAMPLVTAGRLLAQSVPFTTLSAQQRTADYLMEQTAKIDQLIAEAERFIELARERRAAMITAAVTGQIDVRAAA